MRHIEEQRLRAVETATVGLVSIRAVPLSANTDDPLIVRGMRPVNPCVCVVEPCPCDGYDHGNTTVWVPEAFAREAADTGDVDLDGSAIFEYQMPAATTLLIDYVRPVAASELRFELRYRAGAQQGASTPKLDSESSTNEARLAQGALQMWDLLIRAAAVNELSATLGTDRDWRRSRARAAALVPWLRDRFSVQDTSGLEADLRTHGASEDAVSNLVRKAEPYGDLRALLLARLDDVDSDDDTAAACWLSVGLIVAGVLVAPKMPVLGGFAISFGTASAADSC